MLRLEDVFGFEPEQAEYLINYSARFAYVYIETPKVACTSIKRALQSLELGGDEARLPQDVHDKDASPLLSPAEVGLPAIELLRNAQLFRFCFVRNPFTRVLSGYLDKIVNNEWERARLAPTLGLEPTPDIEFARFLAAVLRQSDERRDIHWRSQHCLLQPAFVHYDFVGRFEMLDAHLRRVLGRVRDDGTPDKEKTPLLVENATGSATLLEDYVGAEEAALIQTIYSRDFEAFGYSRDPYFGNV